MEMHQIRYFLAVCETLNFTRAAEACNVTQPALTRAIQKLEEELGGLLFRRERSLSHLTDLGRLMRPRLERVLAQTEEAKATASSFLTLDNAPLNLGVMCTVGATRFVGFLADFQARHEGIELSVMEGVPGRLASLLEEGAIDVAVMAQPEPFSERMNVHPLYTERFLVAVPVGHRLEGKNAIQLADLEGESYLSRVNCEYRDHIRQMRERQNVNIRYAFRSERDDWIQTLVAAGMGFCILPETLPCLPGIVTRPLLDPEITREVSLVTMSGRRFSPAASTLVRALKSFRWSGGTGMAERPGAA
ncbi:LysR family transcriptional regulator [Vineibacter terrae]|uniref:LysR family transcriptional regulator n=1 Tax=Vineibacter terrae TaxID=2586908 RepID=UPI002E376719|nr:LysR family transcriptional regulator [Vineibacter terrae]HEX2891434.1 LysR family transcriptional regulator [Vineibacter terrae]